MDTDKRHEIRGSETKDFVTHGRSGGQSFTITCFGSPCTPRLMEGLMMGVCKQNGLHLEDRNTELGDLPFAVSGRNPGLSFGEDSRGPLELACCKHNPDKWCS